MSPKPIHRFRHPICFGQPLHSDARNGRKAFWIIWGCLIGLFILGLFLASCATTVTPHTNTPAAASWDGNQQNSGILSNLPGGAFLVTPHFRDRYNGLIDIYGHTYSPPIEHDAGIKPAPDGTNWIMDAEHMQKFVAMNLKKKSGIAPN